MSDDDPDIITEIRQMGPRTVRVTAMHTPTLTEVAVAGDASYSESHLRSLAYRKLRYVMAREQEKQDEAERQRQRQQQGRGGVKVRKDKLGLMSGGNPGK